MSQCSVYCTWLMPWRLCQSAVMLLNPGTCSALMKATFFLPMKTCCVLPSVVTPVGFPHLFTLVLTDMLVYTNTSSPKNKKDGLEL